MYSIEIESKQFEGLTVLKQHKLVREVLKEDLLKWHGISLVTRTPGGK